MEHLLYVITKWDFISAEPRQYSPEGIHLIGSLKEVFVQGCIVHCSRFFGRLTSTLLKGVGASQFPNSVLKSDRSVYLLLIELAPFHESCESGTIHHSKFHHFTNLLGGRDVFWLVNTGKESYRAILNDHLRGL